MSASEKKKQREAANERQKQCRKRRKLALSSPENPSTSNVSTPSPMPYTVRQTYSKALGKSLRSLPKSPSKKLAIVSGLASHVGLKLSQKMEDATNGNNIDVLQTLVINYFSQSDIVYTAPGQKDEMTIWVKGERKRVRKYYLMLHLKEAHFLFKEKYPDYQIGYSKFCSLRPENVLFIKDTPVNQCKCFKHENFEMMLNGLKLKYNHRFLGKFLCSETVDKNQVLQSDCWRNECENCRDGNLLTMDSVDPMFTAETRVNWNQWVKHQDTKRLEIKCHEGCAAELLYEIKTAIPDFKEHVRIKRIQASAFESDKENSLVLQLDFAMNYTCEWQGEVQSALWSRKSVTLFTAAMFDAKNTKCFLIVSDTRDKTKNTVAVFLTNLLYMIETKSKPKLIIWTDGPSSEFKNRYMAYFLYLLNCKFQEKFESIDWKYTATSHGKGVVDGIGGSAKSRVRAEVMGHREVVQTAKDFSIVAAKVMPNVTVMPIMQEQIDAESGSIDWSNAIKIKGIQSVHSIINCNSELHFYIDCRSLQPAIVKRYSGGT